MLISPSSPLTAVPATAQIPLAMAGGDGDVAWIELLVMVTLCLGALAWLVVLGAREDV